MPADFARAATYDREYRITSAYRTHRRLKLEGGGYDSMLGVETMPVPPEGRGWRLTQVLQFQGSVEFRYVWERILVSKEE